jgi:hypothetical protein
MDPDLCNGLIIPLHQSSGQGIASLYKSSRKPLYLAFLDLSKAFDRVWRDGLFALLWENGIKGKCWRLLREMYEKVENKVIFGDFESQKTIYQF